MSLLTNMAKFAGLPWDAVLSAELFETQARPQNLSRRARPCRPAAGRGDDDAAHSQDLKAAQKLGLGRLRCASDRIRPAEIRFRGEGRLGYRGEGFSESPIG
jgi:hypothetical protein